MGLMEHVRELLGEDGAVQRAIHDQGVAMAVEADKKLTEIARPLVQSALDNGDYKKARAIAAAMGDSVGRVFMLDMIRQGRRSR